MQENLEEKISMLLDNELSSDEAILVLEKINENEELKEVWQRYNAIRSGLVTEPYRQFDTGFNERISRELDDGAVVVRGPWSKPLSYGKWGYALAASFVAAVVFTWFQGVPAPTISDNSPIAEGEILPTPEALLETKDNAQLQPSETLAKVENNLQPSANAFRTAYDRPIIPLDPRVKDYLVTHNQASSLTGVQGMLPYARVVTFESK